ncbi:MAG: helix-hairpin-helix domain-containing protein [Promethearchaeota archaeon]|nr:MAG: helix-hairpin-helix domain-containing protein [Candidatus Lokiarchaeota archaeon]
MIRMQELEKSVLNKKPDLSTYYKLAQEAFQENDVEEALKFSKSGLEQAKQLQSDDWVKKFNSFSTNVSELKSLVPSIQKESLTIISGIGPKSAERLVAYGIRSISELANSSPIRLSKIEGIGLSTAEKYINGAKDHLRLKKLNDFPNPRKTQETLDTIQESSKEMKTEPEPILESPEYEFEDLEPEKIEAQERFERDIEIEDEISNDKDSEDYEDLAEEHNDINNNSIEERIDMESPIPFPKQVVISPEVVRQSTLALQEKEATTNELLSHLQIKEFHQQIAKYLNLSDFIIIDKIPQLRAVFVGVDLIAVKHIQVKEFLDLIYIIPLKICSLKGSLIVSNENVKYHPKEKNSESNAYRLELLPQSFLKALSQAEQSISSDIINQGNLFKYLSRYLGLQITLEKSITRKDLFFRSGPLQYKILIEPLLITQNTVGFIEKLIPFAYQNQSNIHIVELNKLSDLLQYLDQKYFLLETYSEEKTAIELNFEASNKFMKDLRNYSAPFMLYGLVVLLIILFQTYSVLPLLINLGYGVVIFYCFVVGYVYLTLYKQKSALHQQFSTPYYQKKENFDDGTLIMIREELSQKLMVQFLYECVGKNSANIFINKIETDNAEKYLEEQQRKKKIKDSDLFEDEISEDSENLENSNESKPKSRLKYVDKYSSFLED